MAEKATIARPYAKAAFSYAREHNALVTWSDTLALASAVVSEPKVNRLLGNPRVTAKQLVDLLTDIVGDKLAPQGRQFFDTLAANGRLGLLPEITEMYEGMRADLEKVADVEITAAVDLNQAQRDRLSAALRKRLQRDVRLHVSVDPSLVGGAVVRSGDLVIDGSLKAQLDRLGQVIAH